MVNQKWWHRLSNMVECDLLKDPPVLIKIRCSVLKALFKMTKGSSCVCTTSLLYSSHDRATPRVLLLLSLRVLSLLSSTGRISARIPLPHDVRTSLFGVGFSCSQRLIQDQTWPLLTSLFYFCAKAKTGVKPACHLLTANAQKEQVWRQCLQILTLWEREYVLYTGAAWVSQIVQWLTALWVF